MSESDKPEEFAWPDPADFEEPEVNDPPPYEKYLERLADDVGIIRAWTQYFGILSVFSLILTLILIFGRSR